MARLFDDASTQWMDSATVPFTVPPFTIATWFNVDTDTGWAATLGVQTASAGYELLVDPGSTLNFYAGGQNCNTSTAPSTNTWHHACGVAAATNDRRSYLDGGGKATNTTGVSIGNATSAVLGIRATSPHSIWKLSGMLAESAFWDVALNDAEAAMLASGLSPLLVRPQSLVVYWPLIRDSLADLIDGLVLTPYNGPTVAEHPGIYYSIPSVPMVRRSLVNGFIQQYFRIRSGDTVALDADTGWAAAENTNATIGTGEFFRVRFKVREIGTAEPATAFKLQCKHESGSWADIGVPDDLGTWAACVEGIPSAIYTDGDATSTARLTTVSTWVNGEGVCSAAEGNIVTGSITFDATETEIEYCIRLVPFFYDPASTSDQLQAGDTVELRLVESDGTVFPNTYANPVITVSETAGFIGCTSIESRARIMHFDGNDNLYVLCEDNGESGQARRMVLKSTDRGDTWREIDNANKPSQDDWEAGDMHVVGTVGYMGSQLNNNVYHDTINFSTDAWGTTDEAIRTGVTRDDQTAAIVRRSDGSMVAFWQEQNTDFRIRYSIKNGSWAAPIDLDSESGKDFFHVLAVLGESDKTHIFYSTVTDGNLYHRSLSSADSLSGRETVHNDVGTGGTDEKPMVGAVYYDASGTERVVVAFRDESDGLIYTSKVDDDGSPSTPVAASDYGVKQSGIGDRQVTGDLVNIGSDLWIAYAHVTTGEVWLTKSANYGSWDTDTKIHAEKVYVVSALAYEPSDSSKQLGVYYEADSTQSSIIGLNGFGAFFEYELEAGVTGGERGTGRGIMRGVGRGT